MTAPLEGAPVAILLVAAALLVATGTIRPVVEARASQALALTVDRPSDTPPPSLPIFPGQPSS